MTKSFINVANIFSFYFCIPSLLLETEDNRDPESNIYRRAPLRPPSLKCQDIQNHIYTLDTLKPNTLGQ